MNRALATAYAASVARVASWVIVFGLVFRHAGEAGTAHLAVLALARGTVGLLGYASLGLVPVLLRLLNRDAADAAAVQRSYSTAGLLIAGATACGAVALGGYVAWLDQFHALTLPRHDEMTVFATVGLGTLLRAFSDWFASALLARGRIVTDNLCQIGADTAFVASAFIWTGSPAVGAGCGFLVSGALLCVLRGAMAGRVVRARFTAIDRALLLPIAVLGGAVVVGQLADWMYAPFNQILIHHFLEPGLVASYAIAIQIDGGLLLLIGGLANVLLPAAAAAFQEGRTDDLRRQYVRATLAGLALLSIGALTVVAAARPLFEMWLGESMPVARSILPWVLLHTVLGGTASIGRSVLLAIGEVKAYTLSALAGGIGNATLATLAVTHTSLGLHGVVLATVLTVAVRCGVWMPWYTLRCLRRARPSPI